MRFLPGAGLLSARLMACAALAAAAPAWAETPRKIDFAHDVVPLLKARCGKCHTNGTYKGSLSLDTRADLLRGKVVVPGHSGRSELVERISSTDPEMRMPPKGPRLTAAEVALLRAWIDQGLPWQPGFSFKTSTYAAPLKLRRPVLPPARPGREHPIDRLVDAYQAAHRVPSPPPLDDAAFARRLSLDLIGLLPAPAELNAFRADAAPDKQARLARRLLAEKRSYAEHWLTFWNDLLRNDYAGTGYIDGGRKQVTAWLYRALLDDKPYDQLVRALISPTAESEGFIRGIKWRGRVNASQVPELQFSQNVAQVFFGINMKCASCHDSFIDTWKLEDAYGLAAITAERPLEIHRCDKPTGKKAVPRFVFPELGAIDAARPRAQRLDQLARLVTHPDNGRFARTIANRVWQRLMGRGLVHPVDVMANRPWSEELLDYLAGYLVDNHYDLKKLIEHIVTSRCYQAQAVARAEEPPADGYVFRGPEVKRLTAEQFLDAVHQITGTAPAKPDAKVVPPPFGLTVPPERRFVRAALLKSSALMRSLGRPNREQVVTTRPDQLTTLEALDLSNGPPLADALSRGAARLLRDQRGADAPRLVAEVYRRALCRRPTSAEQAIGVELVGSPPTAEGLADLLWAVFMLPEFQLIR